MGYVMISCPVTGRAISTGIETDHFSIRIGPFPIHTYRFAIHTSRKTIHVTIFHKLLVNNENKRLTCSRGSRKNLLDYVIPQFQLISGTAE